MEPLARQRYEEIFSVEVQEVGLCLKPGQTWLGASPDGIIHLSGESYLLEIKCPFSNRGSEISPKYVVNGELCKTHAYYTQIQIQLYVCNLQKCDLFLYSATDQMIIPVIRDDDFL